MDEVLRAKRLREEILRRAESIKTTMNMVNESMAKIELIERTSVEQAFQAAAPRLHLFDLPDDCIGYVARHLDYASVCSLAQVCIRLQNLVYNDHKGWEIRCRTDWGIVDLYPDLIPRLETCLATSQPPIPIPPTTTATCITSPRATHDSLSPAVPDGLSFDDIVSPRRSSGGGAGALASPRRHTAEATAQGSPARTPLSPNSGGAASINLEPACLFSLGDERHSRPAGVLGSPSRLGSARACSRRSVPGSSARPSRPSSAGMGSVDAAVEIVPGAGSLWRLIYRDRTQGWQLVLSLLDWLHTHGSPRGVSGSMHRLQLLLALRYMALGTGHPHDAPRKLEVVRHEGLTSLLALVGNDSGQVVEGALHVLANIIQGDSNNKVMMMIGSRMGKTFTDKLDMDGDLQGVVQQACRALINMWAESPTPEACVLDAHNGPAHPQLTPGIWSLQEYTLRGVAGQPALKICISFQQEENGIVEFIGAGLSGTGSEEDVQGCEVSGQIDLIRRTWTWQRVSEHTQQNTLYKGYSDAHGSFGLYAIKRAGGSAASFMISSSRQPRVYRLYKDATDAPVDVPAAESSTDAMQE